VNNSCIPRHPESVLVEDYTCALPSSLASELLGADCPFDMRGEIVASRRTAHAIRRHADFLACHDAYSFERRIPHLDKSGADVINAGGGCL